MSKTILGFIVGASVTIISLRFNEIDWQSILTPIFLQALLTIGLAALAGFIALHKVKLNLLLSYKIRRIEEFKLNLTEYISQTHLALWSLKIYFKNTETKQYYYDKYFDALNKSTLHRNKIFLELDLKNHLEGKIVECMLNLNSLLDKFIDGKLDPIIEFEISAKQVELESLSAELLKIELAKSKNLFR